MFSIYLPRPSSISVAPRLKDGPEPGTEQGARLKPIVPKIEVKHYRISI